MNVAARLNEFTVIYSGNVAKGTGLEHGNETWNCGRKFSEGTTCTTSINELSTANISKLKVAELKTELSMRCLATTGKKDELAWGLLAAINSPNCGLRGLDRLANKDVDIGGDSGGSVGVFGRKEDGPKKGWEKKSKNRKCGSLGAHKFHGEFSLNILYISVRFLAPCSYFEASQFQTINAILPNNVYYFGVGCC